MTRPDITAALSHHADEAGTVYALEDSMDENEIEIDGVRYVAVPRGGRGECGMCVARFEPGYDAMSCYALPPCEDGRNVAFVRATD